MKIQSCLSCYVKTKGICTWTSQPPYLPSAKSGATTSIPRKAPSEHDELSSEGDDGPANTSPPDIFAHLDLDGPQFEEEEGMITVANPSTPSKAVRKRDAALGSSGRKTKKPKTDVSLSHKKTSSGLPENPGRAQHSARTFRPVQTFAPPAPLEPAPPTPAPPSSGSPTPPPAPPAPLTPSPPSPDEWLAIRDAPTPDPKGKARAEFERPSESANRVQSASTTAQPSLHAPSSLAPGPHSPFGRFAQVESASINREQQSHPHPPAVANPPPVDLATSNRSRLQKTYDSSRDAIQAVLNQFAEDHANISRDLNEQYRILADAKGAQTRAEQDLVKEKETSDSLKRQLLVVETRNSELSGANRDYKVRLENLLAENQRANKANQEALGRLRDAKVVAEERQDTAANERTRAFEDRDKARAESEVNKKEAKTAEAVVRRAVQEKKDVVREAEDLREQVKLLTGELVSYRTASSSHAQERPGELEAIVGPNDAAQLAQEQVLAKELGLAPPSSC